MTDTLSAAEQSVAKVGDVWFRYEQCTYGSVDEFDNLVSTRHELELRKFKVAKVTPKGVWLKRSVLGNRFVLYSAKRRFADPTQDAALASFKQRKLRQISILQSQLQVAQTMLVRADQMLNTMKATTLAESLLLLES